MILVIILTHSNLAFKHQIGKTLEHQELCGSLIEGQEAQLDIHLDT